MLDRYRVGFDKIGVVLSGICLVHCLCLPLIFLLFPIVREQMGHDHFHALIFAPIVLISLFSFVPAYKKMRKKRVLIIPLVAISIFSLTEFVIHSHDGYTSSVLNSLAGILLLYTHLYNLKHARCCLKH